MWWLSARELLGNHGGRVPSTSLELRSLPGVGDYVANAVLCFAFNKRAVLLDTNTERIVARLRGTSSVLRAQMRMDLYDLAGRSGPDQDFNYALLDLGALVCRAGKPACDCCPVQRLCATGSARAASRVGILAPGTPGWQAVTARVTLLPSARRLMKSLREIGYDLPTGIADIVDNSIAAGATRVDVTFAFEGADSWITSPMTARV